MGALAAATTDGLPRLSIRSMPAPCGSDGLPVAGVGAAAAGRLAVEETSPEAPSAEAVPGQQANIAVSGASAHAPPIRTGREQLTEISHLQPQADATCLAPPAATGRGVAHQGLHAPCPIPYCSAMGLASCVTTFGRTSLGHGQAGGSTTERSGAGKTRRRLVRRSPGCGSTVLPAWQPDRGLGQRGLG
jgi:hypothetical protein